MSKLIAFLSESLVLRQQLDLSYGLSGRLYGASRDRALIVVALMALCLVGWGLRAYALDAQSIWRDEAMAWNFARQPTGASVVTAAIEGDLHPPLYYLALHLAIRLFGDTAFGLRLLSVMSSALLIPMGYALGTRLFDQRIGLLAALVLSLSPFVLRYSQEARMYSLLAILALLTTYCLVRWLHRPTSARLLAVVLTMTATLYTHNWGFFLLAALNLYVCGVFLTDSTRRRDFRPWLVANVLIVLLYLPWLPTLIHQLGYSTAWITSEFSPGQLLLQTLQAWTGAWRATPFYVALLALALLSTFTLSRQHPRIRFAESSSSVRYLLTVCCVPLIVALMLSQLKPMYKPDRYTILVYPAFSILLAVGLTCLRKQWLIGLGSVVLVILSLNKDAYYLTTPYKSPARDVAAYVATHIGPQDILTFAPDPIGQSFNYYYAGEHFQIGYANWEAPRHWRIDGWVNAWFEPDALDKTLAQIEHQLSGDACLWLIYTPGSISIPGAEHAVEQFRQSLGNRYSLRQTIAYPELFEIMQIDVYCR